MQKETDKFVRVGYDIIDSHNFKKLPHSAKVLYLYIRGSKRRVNKYGRVTNHEFNELRFGHASVKDVMSASTYHKAKAELIRNGFIDMVSPGEFKNVKAVFALSDRWRQDSPSQDLYDSAF